MLEIVVHLSGPKWTQEGEKWVMALNGTMLADDRFLDVHEFSALIGPSIEIADTQLLETILRRCNGFHAWVCYSKTRLLAGVDHVRSWPLFYGQREGRFYLSDDAEWVRCQVDDEDMDPVAHDEFLLAGYVTGADTLYPRVKQLQAGEYLTVEANCTGFSLRCARYFRFLHVEPAVWSPQALRERLEEVTYRAINRLVAFARGRQIVVPLSGGYDSRLIVSGLKKLGYDNIVCFSYGVPGNKEAVYSRAIAESLCVPWMFIEYSADGWRKVWRTSAADQYRQSAANHVSLPHVQDWAAIRELIDLAKIDSSAVLVPGHTGDFISGGHIPSVVFTRKDHKESTLLEELIGRHLANVPRAGLALEQAEKLHERLKDRIGVPFDGTDEGFANAYELWDWQERQAKYIVNSVRVYDQFQLDWWLPLWDLEFVLFWMEVPLRLRKGREWFRDWIIKEYQSVAIECREEGRSNASEHSSVQATLTRIANMVLPNILQERLRKIRRYRTHSNHFLAFEGLVTGGDLRHYLDRKFSIIGIYSDLHLKGKW